LYFLASVRLIVPWVPHRVRLKFLFTRS
jgi:hypothetical protein